MPLIKHLLVAVHLADGVLGVASELADEACRGVVEVALEELD